MKKKKSVAPIIITVLILLAILGVVAFFFWPWKSLSSEIQKALGGKGKLMAVSVEKTSLTMDGSQHVAALNSSSMEAKLIVEEIERTKVMYLRNEGGMGTYGTVYTVNLKMAGENSQIGVVVKDSGEVHLSLVGKTYRITSKDSRLYEMLRQAYQDAAG